MFETITTSSLRETDGIRKDDVAYRIVLKGKSGESDNIFTYNDNNVMINDVYYSISDNEYSKIMSNIACLEGQAEDINDLSSANLDGTPYLVLNKFDYDAAMDYKLALMATDLDNQVVEIHGEAYPFMDTYTVYIYEEEGSSNYIPIDVHLVDGTDLDSLPKEGESVRVRGIVWKVGTLKQMVTDAAHITAE